MDPLDCGTAKTYSKILYLTYTRILLIVGDMGTINLSFLA